MDWIGLALSLGNEILKKMPDYDVRKAEEFYEEQNKYNLEKVKSYPLRDDDLLMNLKESLQAHLEMIQREAKK